MLVVALLCAHDAVAQQPDSITATSLEYWRQELTGPIEAAAGRPFVERPKMRIVSERTLHEREAALVRLGFEPPEHAPRETNVLGRYLLPTQEILLTPGAWRVRFGPGRLDEALFEPAVKCVVAHEMVHALAHPYLPHTDDEVTDALREGFADHVAGKVCGKGKRTLDRLDGAEVPAGRDPSDPRVFAYAYGEAFVATLEEVAGREAVWAAMAGAPVSRELVERVATLGVPSGWADPARLAPIGAAMADLERGEVTARVVSARQRIVPYLGEDRLRDDLPVHAGLEWGAAIGDHAATALAFLVRDPEDASAWVRARRMLGAAQGAIHPLIRSAYFYDSLKVGRVRTLARLDGVTDTLSLRIDVSGDWTYLEQWVVRGRHLLGGAVFDTRPDPKRLTAAMAALVALDLPDVPVDATLSEADRAALLALASAPPAATAARWEYRYAQQHPAMLAGDWAGCAAGFEEAMDAFDGPARASLAVGGMRCALAGDDLATASRLLAEVGGPARLDPSTARQYAAACEAAEGDARARCDAVLATLPR